MSWHRIWRTNGQAPLLFCALAGAALLSTNAYAEPDSANSDTASADVRTIWSHFVEVNKVWLDPRPKHLSYVAIAELKNDDGITKSTNRVWVDGDNACWEMEFGSSRANDREKLEYTLVCADCKEAYLRAPVDSMLKQLVPARDTRPLRQAIEWYSSAHAIYHLGLPADCRIVSRNRLDDGEVAVLQMNLPNSRSGLGLGLYHAFLGQSNVRIGRVQLHIRLPECIPIREEFLDRQISTEYDPTFIRFGDQRAPARVRLVSRTFDQKPWILEARFHNTHGLWLLDRALNIQDEKVVAEMKVSCVSTAAIDPAKFKISAPDQD